MKNIINPILRILIALVGVYILFAYIFEEIRSGDIKFRIFKFEFFAITGITVIVIAYMMINAGREIMQKRIKLRGLYVIIAIVTLISLVQALSLSGNLANGGATGTDFISCVTLILMLYFSIADLVELFLKSHVEDSAVNTEL
jgi:hypothetical protein